MLFKSPMLYIHTIKTKRFSLIDPNLSKQKQLVKLCLCARELKNVISFSLYEHLPLVIDKSKTETQIITYFYHLLKEHRPDFFPAWSFQYILRQLIKEYRKLFTNQINKHNFLVQKGFKRKTKSKKTKKQPLFQQTTLTRLLNLFLKTSFDTLEALKQWLKKTGEKNKLFLAYIEYLQAKGLETRINALVKTRKERLWQKIKPILIKSCLFPFLCQKDVNLNFLSPCGKSYSFVYDRENGLYKYFLQIGGINYPLKVSRVLVEGEGKFNRKAWYHAELCLKAEELFGKGRVINIKYLEDKDTFIIFGNYEEGIYLDTQLEKDLNKVLGGDINLKDNFLTLSDGRRIEYDKKYFEELIELLEEIDRLQRRVEALRKRDKREEAERLERKRLKRWQKLIRRNEWYFKKLISELLEELRREGITTLCLEELELYRTVRNRIRDKELRQRYTRLVRVLRLSSVKVWFREIGLKKGVKVHWLVSAYSSQECERCGYIGKRNRESREEFVCQRCGYRADAQLNAARVIKKRYWLEVEGKINL